VSFQDKLVMSCILVGIISTTLGGAALYYAGKNMYIPLGHGNPQCANLSLTQMYVARVTGTSMLPTLETDDTILMARYNSSRELREGVIVQVNSTIINSSGVAKTYIHRLSGLYGDDILTVGDNNFNSRDDLVARNKTIGSVCVIIKEGSVKW
jgi:phage repressor protein C with HTH and peptisase S24 domain